MSIKKTGTDQLQQYDEEPYYDEFYGDENDSLDIGKVNTHHPRYKTQMCYNMLNKGECNFPGCTFAHSEKERRKPKQVKKLEHGRYYNENAPLVYNY